MLGIDKDITESNVMQEICIATKFHLKMLEK